MNRRRAEELLEAIQNLRIAVVGDLMLDSYIWGSATRISPEAPVPIVKVNRRTTVLGGAANVLRNLATLGAEGLACGMVGQDANGKHLVELCEQGGIDTEGIVFHQDRPTTVKTRVIADRQQVVRIDEEDDQTASTDSHEQLLSQLRSRIGSGDLHGIIIEDYNKGLITPAVAAEIRSMARDAGVFVALDPHPGNPLHVTGLSLMTPNRSEAFALAGEYHTPTVQPVADDSPLNRVGDSLLESWEPELLLITLGPDGMALFQPDQPLHHVPTVAREVFDVSGAGDTVIAAFTVSRLAGASVHEAIIFANHAAGVVVGKTGTIPVDTAELLDSFDRHE